MAACAFDKLFTKSVPHILEKIFFSLDFASYMKCHQVSNNWNELLTSESFKRLGKAKFHEEAQRELRHAIQIGDADEVGRVLSSGMADVNHLAGKQGRSLLYDAVNAQKSKIHVVQLLLDHGADPNQAITDGWTPLHIAAYKGDIDVVKLLLHRGANPNMASWRGTTALHTAAMWGKKDVVQVLLDAGAEINKATSDGRTALSCALQYDYVDIAKILRERGAH